MQASILSLGYHPTCKQSNRNEDYSMNSDSKVEAEQEFSYVYKDLFLEARVLTSNSSLKKFGQKSSSKYVHEESNLYLTLDSCMTASIYCPLHGSVSSCMDK
jgi:hypothetical protein